MALYAAAAMPAWAATTCVSAANSTDVENCGMALFETRYSDAENREHFKACVAGEMKKQGFNEGKDFTVRVVKDPASDLNGAVCTRQRK